MSGRTGTAILWLRWRRYWLARKVYDRLRPWVIREGDALIAIEFGGLDSGSQEARP